MCVCVCVCVCVRACVRACVHVCVILLVLLNLSAVFDTVSLDILSQLFKHRFNFKHIFQTESSV